MEGTRGETIGAWGADYPDYLKVGIHKGEEIWHQKTHVNSAKPAPDLQSFMLPRLYALSIQLRDNPKAQGEKADEQLENAEKLLREYHAAFFSGKGFNWEEWNGKLRKAGLGDEKVQEGLGRMDKKMEQLVARERTRWDQFNKARKGKDENEQDKILITVFEDVKIMVDKFLQRDRLLEFLRGWDGDRTSIDHFLKLVEEYKTDKTTLDHKALGSAGLKSEFEQFVKALAAVYKTVTEPKDHHEKLYLQRVEWELEHHVQPALQEMIEKPYPAAEYQNPEDFSRAPDARKMLQVYTRELGFRLLVLVGANLRKGSQELFQSIQVGEKPWNLLKKMCVVVFDPGIAMWQYTHYSRANITFFFWLEQARLKNFRSVVVLSVG